MGGIFFWLVLVACVLALVVLFFPFRFKAEFEAGENGGKISLFFFAKRLWTGEKKWGRKKADDTAEDSGDDADDSDTAVPEFVAAPPKQAVEKKAAPAQETPKESPEPVKPAERPAEREEKPAVKDVPKPAEEKATSSDATAKKPAPEPKPVEEPKEKKEKRSLTDEEFWTIILTPDLDGRAFRYVKSLLGIIVRLFNIRFENCFVEGIRSDYESMGYGAAANAVLKGFPYLESWDIRMDWCHDRDLRTEGTVHARTNLCRAFFLLLATLFYAAVLFVIFWCRRSRVLKTGELPELGYVRKKIVGWMVED